MDYLPLFLRIANRDCLIVGGGQVALRKARLLHRGGARLHVVAPQIDAQLRELVRASAGSMVERAFTAADVRADFALVVAATPLPDVQAEVAQVARAQRVWVNAVDSAVLSDAIFPSLIDRDPLLVAISSGGSAPVLLRQWRERLEALLPSRLGDLVRFAGAQRAHVKQQLPDPTLRRRFWERIFSGAVANAALAGDEAGARALLTRELSSVDTAVIGEVYVVGAGPGAPDLLTLRALQLMQQADVVLHDQLVSERILDLVRRDAVRVNVGKRGGAEGVASANNTEQAHINAEMVTHARAGKRVLRLKGGDPFVFGRGGEEIEALLEAGIPFQLVPGITAATGCAAYAGIPLTHRDVAHSVCFVTGQRRDTQGAIDWSALLRSGQTLVVYMGGRRLAEISSELRSAGCAATTPIAMIARGTLPDQVVVTGTLLDIAERWANVQAQVQAPAQGIGPSLAIIGEVVNYRVTSVGAVARAPAQSQETTESWSTTSPTSSS